MKMDLEKKQSIQLEDVSIKSKVPDEKGADFEKAVSACGYGKFHYLLFLVVIPASWASVLDSSNMSMIIPSAECDLKLSIYHKGVLNGITYAGMVSSALMWGFLADVMGRRRILVYGYLADGLCNIMCGFSQNFATIVVFKFLSGFIVSGPYATIMTYCNEFFRTKDRPRITLAIGFTCFAGCIVNAGLAWLIVPQNWYFEIGDKTFIYNSWRMYLSACGIPMLIGSFGFSHFPESPKFLMSQGRNKEALEVFKRIYSINTGKSRDSYPIKLLEDELKDESKNQNKDPITVEQAATAAAADNVESSTKRIKNNINKGLHQMKPLFVGSYLSRLLLVVLIQGGGMLCANTIRLWQPQIFTTLSSHLNDNGGVLNCTFCEILDNSTKHSTKPANISHNVIGAIECIPKIVNSSVYMYTILVSSTTNTCLFLATLIVNLTGNKNLLLICFIFSTGAILTLNFANNYILIVALTCVFVGLMCTTTNLVISVIVNIFPTSLRTMAVSLAMMIGRVGALSGNVLFPVFLDFGCFIALVSLASILVVSAILTFFVPKHKDNVK